MKQIPINDDKIPGYNKKAIRLIILLIVCGIIAGFLLSIVFVDQANYRLEHPNDRHKPMPPPNWDVNNSLFNNSFLNNSYYSSREPLTILEVILPTIGVMIVCISTFLLIGLIAVYVKIFLTTGSRYVVGLLLFLMPLLIQTFFFIYAMGNLFDVYRIPFYRGSFGFEFGGLGGVLIIVSIIESIGLSILLYLSSE